MKPLTKNQFYLPENMLKLDDGNLEFNMFFWGCNPHTSRRIDKETGGRKVLDIVPPTATVFRRLCMISLTIIWSPLRNTANTQHAA
jgi:hypothetical protein